MNRSSVRLRWAAPFITNKVWPGGVMVALRFLVPLDGVRIPAGLPSYVPLRGTSDGTPFFYRFVELRMARHFFIASWNFGWHGIFFYVSGLGIFIERGSRDFVRSLKRVVGCFCLVYVLCVQNPECR